ncbi:hypothetical protein LA080_004129 [Diaporthe eres]|nr:hypothetical protein LA080_004129 [Diaporthe eres]
MNGRPSEFTSQVNHAQFHCPNLLFPGPPGASLGSVQLNGGCQFGPLLMMETLFRDALADYLSDHLWRSLQA